MYVSQWPIFHVPVILPYILKIIWWTNVIIGILDPCDVNIYHIKCVWVSDLHFMVQWFCLITWRLFDGLMLYWRYWFSVTQTLNWNYICRSVTNISCSCDFALYLKDYLMEKCRNWNIGSMWCKDLPYKMYVDQWPIFHGPVILSYILKTFWWRNVALKTLIQCNIKFDLQGYKYILYRSVTYILWYNDSALYFQHYLMNKPHSLDIGSDMGHWTVFHDLAILNHLPISAYSGLLKFDMKIFLNVARLEVGQLFTQGTRRGHSCTLYTFLVYL